MSMTKISGSGSISQRHGSADPAPDPYQNVMNPQHCIHVIASHFVQEYFLEDCIQMTNFVPGPALRGRDKKNNKRGNNEEEEEDEGMDDDEGKFNPITQCWGSVTFLC